MLLYFKFPRFNESSTFKVAVVRTPASSVCENWNGAPGQDCVGSSIQGWSCLIDSGGFGVAITWITDALHTETRRVSSPVVAVSPSAARGTTTGGNGGVRPGRGGGLRPGTSWQEQKGRGAA